MDEGVEEDMMGKDSLAVAPPKKEFKVYKMMENVCSGESFLFFTFHPKLHYISTDAYCVLYCKILCFVCSILDY